jgi:S-adenosylmethionine synthetase
MTMEAAAGKNPVTHVGKLYSLLANRIAAALVTDLKDVTGAGVVLVSAIGQAVSDPRLVDLRLRLPESCELSALRPRVSDIVAAAFNSLSDLREALLQQTVTVV